VYTFDQNLVSNIVPLLESRRNRVSMSITERELYIDVDGQAFTSTIAEHHASSNRQ
jgi:hypothetical protein